MLLHLLAVVCTIWSGYNGYRRYVLYRIHNELYKLLKSFKSILNKLNIPYFAIGGTLLGACREHGIIHHDDDIDIGILRDDFTKLLAIEEFYNLLDEQDLMLELSGAKLAHRIYFRNAYYNIFIDIFEYEQNDDIITLCDERQKERWPDDMFSKQELYPLTSYRFGDLYITGPHCPYPYLERLYGAWMIPVYTHDHFDQIIKYKYR